MDSTDDPPLRLPPTPAEWELMKSERDRYKAALEICAKGCPCWYGDHHEDCIVIVTATNALRGTSEKKA